MSIRIRHLHKDFKLYRSHAERVKEAFHPFRKKFHRRFQALRDINLDIQQGETVGIIGQNGSGKSTLLQLICGILTPTKGQVEVDGRISALLELGAGFNPEFTGRENVYLNGSILGFSRDEMKACFGDIVRFADIGPFIDQPVKTYSSGMYVRLAFAVAINVKPDILIVDEALSVGDTLFQAKCFAKFEEFKKKGTTILFVTHSMDLITQYCGRAVLLDRGCLVRQGEPKLVVDAYNRLLVQCGETKGMSAAVPSGSTPETGESRYGVGKAVIEKIGIYDRHGVSVRTLTQGQEYEFRCSIIFRETVSDPVFSYAVKDVKGFDITGTNTLYMKVKTGTVTAGEQVDVSFRQKVVLAGGGYLLSFGCAGFEDGKYIVYERRYDALDFQVVAKRATVGFFEPYATITVTRSTEK